MLNSIVDRCMSTGHACRSDVWMRIWAVAAVACLGGIATWPAVGDVVVGSDLLVTQVQTVEDFDTNPLPMDFFGMGSDPLTGLVALEGVPLIELPLGVARGADTVVERLQTAMFSGCPSADTIDIEIVALHLQSVEPVTVTFNGGNSVCTGLGMPNACCTGPSTGDCETQWQLDVTLSPTLAQATGSMELRHECSIGGSFSTNLPVRPRLMFTRVSGTLGTSPVILDPAPQIDFTSEGSWVYTHGVEGIYRDADSSLAVSAGDTRLSLPGVPVVGSAVALGEDDLGGSLTTFAATERHVDPIVNAVYDAGEGIYRDVDLSGTVSAGDLRLSVRGFSAGSLVAGGDSDLAMALVAFTAVERYEDANEGGSYDDGEGIYDDADSSGDVSLGDARRLLTLPGFPLGSVVAAGNRDDGNALVAFNFEDPSLCTSAGLPFSCCTGVETHDGTCIREMHADPNLNAAYDPEEGVYFDADADGVVSTGDMRITVNGFSHLGSIVAAGDIDFGVALVVFTAAERHVDPDGNGRYDSGLGVLPSPGGMVDGDGDRLIVESFPASGNFTVGVRPSPCTCASGTPELTEEPISEEEILRKHIVLPPVIGSSGGPLAVTLTTFKVKASPRRVLLGWSTDSEIDNEGFNILRSTEPHLPGEIINSGLIPAEGTPSLGASYSLLDDLVRPGETYYYLLEDISTAGESTLHGVDACKFTGGSECEPLQVTIQQPTQKPWRNSDD